MARETALEPRSALEEWKRSWTLVLAASSGMALTAIHIYSTGLFMAPLEAEFAWSRARISSGLTIVSVLGVLFAPVVGVLVDRWSARPIALSGAVLYVLSVMALSLARPSIATWWLLWALIGIASLFIKPTVWSAAVGAAFVKARGLALAVMLCGSGVGATLVPVVTEALLESYGWRSAYRGLGGLFAVVVIPLLWLFFFDGRVTRASASPAASERGGHAVQGWTLREGVRKRQFYQLAAAAVLLTGMIVGCVVHLIPMLVDQGLTRKEAVGLASMLGLLSITGRLTAGVLFDRLPGPPIGMASAALPGVFAGLLLFAPATAAGTLVAVVLLGLAVGAEYDAVIYLSTRYFGLRCFGSLFGFVASCILAGVGIGPLMAGAVFDRTSSYEGFLVGVVYVSIASALLLVSLGAYPDHEESVEAATPA